MLKSLKQNHHQPQVFVVKSSVLMVLSLIFAGKHQPFSTVKSPQVISGPLVVPMRCFAMPNRPKKVREGRWKNMGICHYYCKVFFLMGFSIKTGVLFITLWWWMEGTIWSFPYSMESEARSCELGLPTTWQWHNVCFWWDTWVIFFKQTHIVMFCCFWTLGFPDFLIPLATWRGR